MTAGGAQTEPAAQDRAQRPLPAFHARSQTLTAESAMGAHPNSRPRDAATLIIVDSGGGEPRLLMGQRHHGHRFMPGKFVFPGGRVEPQDYAASRDLALPRALAGKLVRFVRGAPHPHRAKALLHAALRETREETGMVASAGDAASIGMPVGFLARAITPPGRPRRFDTRFFVLPVSSIADRLDIVDGEFSAIHWLSLAEARGADLPLITRVILDDLQERIETHSLADPDWPVPFYFRRGACFHRWLL
jgi:8-oxo-dGTP pyrophosphatase MutT (NUDIX family)